MPDGNLSTQKLINSKNLKRDSRENAYSERRLYLAFFTVVASCSNLSTSFSGTKLVQGERKRKFQRVNIKKMLEFSLLSEAETQ